MTKEQTKAQWFLWDHCAEIITDKNLDTPCDCSWRWVINTMTAFSESELSSFKRELLEKMPTPERMIDYAKTHSRYGINYSIDMENIMEGMNWFRSQIIELLK